MAGIYTVQQGDCLSSIAEEHYFGDWRTIYNHPNNDGFRALRPNPNIIFPGDEIYIPDLNGKDHSAPTDKTHRFVLKLKPTYLRIRVTAGGSKPLSGCNYQLKIASLKLSGSIGSDGLIEQRIPATARAGRLTVQFGNSPAESFTWDLKIGHLDPATTVSGAQARLNNLAFHVGAVDGIFGPKSEATLREFQQTYGLPVTGNLDGATRSKLNEVHDGG
jgi:hypothetical protein